MHLPFAVTIKRSRRDDLRRPGFWLTTCLIILTVAGGILLLRANWSRSTSTAVADATLTITSTPPGATILIGGKERGRTPATLALPPGDVRLTLRLAAHADVTYGVRLTSGQMVTFAGILWLRQPDVRRVRSPLPGAPIVGASFLDDGRLALTVALPPGDEHQLWLVDQDGGAHRAGPPLAQVAITASPDGARVAYLARPASAASAAGFGGPGDARVSEVWITARDGERGERRYVLPPNTADERLVDLSWAPDGTHLLLVSQQRPQGGGLRTRLLWLDLANVEEGAPTARELIGFPSEVIPGSYNWRPDGRRVTLLTRVGGRTALCVAGTDGSLFRSLADVGGEEGGSPPFPPLAWTPDGGVIYADPGDSPNGSFGSPRPVSLVADDLTGAPPRHLGDVTGAPGGAGPGLRDDGVVVVLSRSKANAPAILRAFDSAGDAAQSLGSVTIPAAINGMHWDTGRGRVLVAARNTVFAGDGSGGFDLWLVRWAVSDREVAR